jgi:hypothetical protein
MIEIMTWLLPAPGSPAIVVCLPRVMRPSQIQSILCGATSDARLGRLPAENPCSDQRAWRPWPANRTAETTVEPKAPKNHAQPLGQTVTPHDLSPVSTLPVAEAAGERWHVAVMFCDLVESTGIAAKLDVEEWRDLVGAYIDAASAAVVEMGGHLNTGP